MCGRPRSNLDHRLCFPGLHRLRGLHGLHVDAERPSPSLRDFAAVVRDLRENPLVVWAPERGRPRLNPIRHCEEFSIQIVDCAKFATVDKENELLAVGAVLPLTSR